MSAIEMQQPKTGTVSVDSASEEREAGHAVESKVAHAYYDNSATDGATLRVSNSSQVATPMTDDI